MSDSYDTTEEPSIKPIFKIKNDILTVIITFRFLLRITYPFWTNAAFCWKKMFTLLLDCIDWNRTVIYRCLSTLSSSSSFISNSVGKSPSNVICQFANLVLFYTLCDQISRVSQLYYIKQDELHSSLNASIPIDITKLDISKPISLEYDKLSKKKRKNNVKKENSSTIPDEYEFINSMLWYVCSTNRIVQW